MSTMISFATPSDLPAITNLWKTVFGDTQPFTDFVTQELIVTNNTFVSKQHQTLTGITIIFPVNLYRSKKMYRLYYVYGVGVHPQYRNQKIAAKLLQHITSYAYSNKIDGLVLMPATESLFTYYAKQNFQTAFSLQKITFQREPTNHYAKDKLLSTPLSIQTITELRNSYLQQFPEDAVLWSEQQIQQRYRAAILNREEWFVIQLKDTCVYIMVEKKSDNYLVVKESTCLEQDFDVVNHFLFTHFVTVTTIDYIIHSALRCNGQIIHNGMLLPLSQLPTANYSGYLNLCLD